MGDPAFLGVTDSHGELEIPEIESATSLQVGKQGYLTRSVPLPRTGPVRVELAMGGRVAFRCLLAQTRAPLEGILVLTSAGRIPWSQLDWELPPEDAIPACPVERVVFRAMSDADGRVSFEGLPHGKLAWSALAPEYFLVDGPGLSYPDETDVESNNQSHDLTFDRITVVGYRVVGDEVAHSRVTHALRSGVNFPRASQIISHSIQQRLEAEYPGASVCVMPGGLTADITLVLRERGTQRLTLPYLPIAQYRQEGPVTIDAAELPKEGTRVSLVTLQLENADGSPLDGVAMILTSDRRIVKVLRSNEPTLVAHGTYMLQPSDAGVAVALRGPRAITIGETEPNGECHIALRANVPLRRVEIDKGGWRPVQLVASRSEDKKIVIQTSGESDTVEAFLPIGDYRIEGRDGSTTVMCDAQVTPGDDSPLEIVLKKAGQ